MPVSFRRRTKLALVLDRMITVLEWIPGVGTFAQKSACAESSLIDVRSIGDEIAERGNRHRVIVHCLEEITVPPDIAVKMGYLGIPRRIDT